jgi:ORF6N domain
MEYGHRAIQQKRRIKNNKYFTMAKSKKWVISDELVMSKIYIVRGQKVMLDEDLARLYQVETKGLNQAIKRNKDRFPPDFMFQLSINEFENLKSQFVTSSWGGRRKLPYAFTEQGVAMLSAVLNSEVAVRVSIRIIRVFTKMRELLLTHKDILLQLEKVENKLTGHDEEIALIFEYLKKLLSPPVTARLRVGFRRKEEKE